MTARQKLLRGSPSWLWAASLWLLSSCDSGQPRAAVPVKLESPLAVGARAGKVRLYPCNSCHDKVDPETLAKDGDHHADLAAVHFSGGDCLTCHLKSDMNQLRLLSGSPVSFDQVYALCGQCHHEKLHDFELGAHGKTVGGWNRGRYRFNCTECHNPHAPTMEPVVALPAPPKPVRLIPKKAHP